ncbi:MAG: rhomboid family intramembrane serine protease [Rhodospirillaceae bacterium]|nr:rhomboid family intramembrane serine protease [Rhodospirillaceae bacterium]
MGIVDRGSRDDRRPRSRWPDRGDWRSRSRTPEPPPRRPPPAMGTYVLAGICIAVFVYGYLSGTRTELDLIRDYAFVPADLQSGGGNGYLGLFTHMFLHGDWVHLLVNMIVLLSFGRALEPALGTGRFVILYLVAGVAAAYGHGALTGFPDTPMIGASGATAGIVGAAVLAAPRMPVIFFIIPMPLFVAVIILVALHIAAIALQWDPGIAWWAHLVGLVVGAVLFPLLRRRAVS